MGFAEFIIGRAFARPVGSAYPATTRKASIAAAAVVAPRGCHRSQLSPAAGVLPAAPAEVRRLAATGEVARIARLKVAASACAQVLWPRAAMALPSWALLSGGAGLARK